MAKKIMMTLILLLIILSLMMTMVFAGFDYNSNAIQKSYSSEEKIKGSFSISFNEEYANNKVASNFPSENITLLEFLTRNNKTEDIDFTCSNVGCGNDYSHSSDPVSGFSLVNTEKSVGFVITNREDVTVNSLELNVKSNTATSCFRQIAVDIADKDKNLLSNTNYLNEVCGNENYGCFEQSLGAANYADAVIQTNNDYCEKITLPPGPAYKVGAKIQNKTQGAGILEMGMYDEEGDFLGKCELPKHQQQTEKLSCIIEHPSAEKRNYYVCAGLNGIADFKIKSETNSPCGTKSPGSLNFVADYEIFAQSLKYGSVDFNINDSTFNKFNSNDLGEVVLGSYIDSFIQEKYDRDCVPNCIIPLQFIGLSQGVSLSKAKLIFDSGGSVLTNVFDLSVGESTLSSDDLVLNLEKAGIEVPDKNGASTFSLFIGNENVFSEVVSITPSFEFSILPTFVAFGQETAFRIVSNYSITKSVWNFGDGSIKIVNGNNISHEYLESGLYSINVDASRSDGANSKRSFNVLVGSAEEIVNKTIHDYKINIAKIEEDIIGLPIHIKEEVVNIIDTSALNAALDEIEVRYNEVNNTEKDYIGIVNDLLELDIPLSIGISKQGELPLLIGAGDINTEFIKELSGSGPGDEEKIESAIVSWMDRNFDSDINTEQYAVLYEDGSQEILLSYFRIETKPKNDVEKSYLFLNYEKNNIKFKQNYGEKSVGSGTYIELEAGRSNRIVEFLVLDEIEADQLGAYISPVVGSLGNFEFEFAECNFNNVCEKSLGENWRNCRNDCKPWGRFSIWIGVLLLASFIVYIILQEWYKRHYEKSLFKNSNDLYNLINFIYNARKAGLPDDETKNKLRDKGWKREKIRYAMRKIDGKRVGMFEIPLFKFMENKMVRNELARRQGGVIDRKLIMRPLNR